MRFSSTSLLATAALSSVALATFSASSKTNIITYWGQGANQDRLLKTCQNPSYDIINIGFVDVFPDQGAGGFPGTNFGNACWGDVYKHKGVNTSLLQTCPDIGPDVIACQQTYGKKIFLSIGGGTPNDYYIKNDASGKRFAEFLWQAFGPVSATKKGVPRPWGAAGVDGFDFDIENLMAPAPQADYQTSGYAAMINHLKNDLFPTDTSKSYYISGAPQCTIPDSHLSEVLAEAWFDFLFIQFYNTAACSARARVQKSKGIGSNDISYQKWTEQKSLNPNVRMSIGLPGSRDAAVAANYYLQPAEVQTLITKFYTNKKFGGIMVWEATAAQNNTPCNVDYGTWMKDILTAKAAGTTFNTNIKTCAGVSKRSPKDDLALYLQRRDIVPRRVSTIMASFTTVVPVSVTTTINGKLWTGVYEETSVVSFAYATTVVNGGSASATASQNAPPPSSTANEPAYSTSSYAAASSYVDASSYAAPTHYGGSNTDSSAQPSVYTSVNTITVIPVPVSSTSYQAAFGSSTGAASAPSASSYTNTNGATVGRSSMIGCVFAVLAALLLLA